MPVFYNTQTVSPPITAQIIAHRSLVQNVSTTFTDSRFVVRRRLRPEIPSPPALGLGPGVYVVPPYGSLRPVGEPALASVFVGASFPEGNPHVKFN
jgi:hypothetical protein